MEMGNLYRRKMKKGVNCLNCRKYKNNVDNLNPAMVY